MNLENSPISRVSENVRKLCGIDFDKAVFKSNTHLDKVVFITHQNDSKNFGLNVEYDKIANALKRKYKNVEFMEYNGINENEKFKSPEKLPAVVYFRSGMTVDEKPV
jgi:hypothetical protein